jgi:hypothetical protein
MFLTTALLAAILTANAPSTPTPVSLPAGTRLRFHLVRPLMSDHSKTGQPFSFVLLEAVSVGGRVLVDNGAVGTGTVVLAGHNGTSGHEGDLTLRLDQMPAINGAPVVFCKQQLRLNGRNKKVVSGLLGLIPFAGLGARYIRGSEIHISTKTPIETVLLEATGTPPNYCPVTISKYP